MITQEESGLSATQYETLKAQRIHPRFEVVAHRYNLDFGDAPWLEHPDGTILASSGDVWASAANNRFVYWLTGADTLYRVNTDTGTIERVTTYPGNASHVSGTPTFVSTEPAWGPQELPNRFFDNWTVSSVPDGWEQEPGDHDASNFVEEHADGMRIVSDNTLHAQINFTLPFDISRWQGIEITVDTVHTSGSITVGPSLSDRLISQTSVSTWTEKIGPDNVFVIKGTGAAVDVVVREISCRLQYDDGRYVQITLQQSGGWAFTASNDWGETWEAWKTLNNLEVAADTRLEDFATNNGLASASESVGDFTPQKAFDGNPWGFSYWLSDQTSCWLQFDAGAGVTYTAKQYTFYANEEYRPLSWVFEGSNDASSWTPLDSETDYVYTEVSENGYTFSFTNVTAYQYYRLNVTKQEISGTGILHLYIFEEVSIGDLDIVAHPNNSFEAITALRYTVEGQYKIEQIVDGELKDGDYYWPYAPDSIATTEHNGQHIIALATDLPGPATVKYDHQVDEALNMRHISQGIVVFIYNTSLSDYIPVSVFEPRLEGEQYTNVRLTKMGDTLFLTAHVIRGSIERPVSGYQLFTSKDGRNWSIPQFLGIDNSAIDGNGIELFQAGDYVYAVERTQIWRSYSTLFSGYSPPAMQEDISADIETYNFSMSGMLSAGINLNNGQGQYDDHPIINGQNTIALIHNHGYYIPGVSPSKDIGRYEEKVLRTSPGFYITFGANADPDTEHHPDLVSGGVVYYEPSGTSGVLYQSGIGDGSLAMRMTPNNSRVAAVQDLETRINRILNVDGEYSIMLWLDHYGLVAPTNQGYAMNMAASGYTMRFSEQSNHQRFYFDDNSSTQSPDMMLNCFDVPGFHCFLVRISHQRDAIEGFVDGVEVFSITHNMSEPGSIGELTEAYVGHTSSLSHIDNLGVAHHALWGKWLSNEEVQQVSKADPWDPNGPIMLWAGFTEVDTISDGTNLSTSPQTGQSHVQKLKRIQARGHMGWLSDKTAASMSNYRDGQLLAGDNFDGLQDSGIATMRHFGVENGEWTVRDNKMVLNEILGRESVFTTFSSDVSNVGITFKFTWPAAITDYDKFTVEALIRAVDAENCIAIRIERQAGGQFIISINDRRAGTDTALDTGTATTGWPTAQDTDVYVRVEARDGDIAAWMSQFDNQWSNDADVHVRTRLSTLNRISDSKTIHLSAALPYERGRVGLAVISELTEPTAAMDEDFTFEQFRMFDLAPPLYLEEAVRYFAAKGSLHDIEFQSLASASNNRWNPVRDVQITQYEDYITVGATHKSGEIHYAVHADMNDKGSMIVEYDYEFLVGYGMGTVIGFESQNNYYLAIIEDDNQTLNIYKSTLGAPTLKGSYPLTAPVPETGHIKVAFRQFRQSLDEASIWQAVSVYINGRLLATHIEKNVTLFEDMTFGLAAKAGTMAKISNLHVPELNQFLETIVLDPGERPMSGLQRTFQGFHVRYFVRHDGSLYVWLPKIQDTALEITDLDRDRGVSNTENSRSIFTHIRVVGAYVQAELLRDDLVRKYGYRFLEVNNPYLLTEDECLAEAEFLLNRYEEARTRLQFSMPMVPMIEIEDRISTPEGDRIIDAYNINWTPTQAVWSLTTRGYTFVDDADIATDDTAFLLDVEGRSELDVNTILG